jgi:hypothetical protein
LDSPKDSYEQYIIRPFKLTGFIKDNIRGIIGTLSIHMLLIIIFLLIKIQSFKQTLDLNVVLDLAEAENVELPAAVKPLSPAEEAYLEKLLAQSGSVSNRGENVSEKIEEDISTKSFVEDYLKKLDQSRSEEWLRQQEEIDKKLNQPDYVYTPPEDGNEIELDDYSGPSNIRYEFLEAPYGRYKIYLPVPVYKCRGEGEITVNIIVDQRGIVISAEPVAGADYPDRDCLVEAAVSFAYKTRFEGNFNAPKNHKAKIIYNFIKQ